eukprot:scaffold123816_cov82-Phaeocystis_antarctica.AAC.1
MSNWNCITPHRTFNIVSRGAGPVPTHLPGMRGGLCTTGMADIYTRLVDEQARARTTHNYKAYGMLPTTTVILHR